MSVYFSRNCKIIALLFIFNIVKAQSADEKAVAKAVEALRKEMLKPTQIGLENIAAEKLVYVHSSGTVRDKSGFVKEFITGQTLISTAEITDQNIIITGKIAIVRHHLFAKTVKPGVPDIDIIVLQTWQKKNGKWLLLARQAAKIPPNKI